METEEIVIREITEEQMKQEWSVSTQNVWLF